MLSRARMPSLRLLISVAVVTAAGAFAPVGNNHPKSAVSTRGGREHIGSRTVFRSAEKPWWKVWGDKDGGGEVSRVRCNNRLGPPSNPPR